MKHRETHMREGDWPKYTPMPGLDGIEWGVRHRDESRRTHGRIGLFVTYPEYTKVLVSNSLAIETFLLWDPFSRDPRILRDWCDFRVSCLRQFEYRTWSVSTHTRYYVSAQAGRMLSRHQCCSHRHRYFTPTGAVPSIQATDLQETILVEGTTIVPSRRSSVPS